MNKVKQKTYCNIVIFFFTVMAVFYVGNFYLIEIVKSLSLEIVDKKQKIERLNKQSDQIESIRMGYKYIQEEINETSGLIVNYPDIIEFIVEIENVSQKSEIDLDISASNKEGEYLNNDLSSVSYSITATGDFDNLMCFLVYLENLKYLNKVENIRMYYNDKNKNDLANLDKVNSGEIILNANLEVYVKNRDLK